jgi:hypothetical protein
MQNYYCLLLLEKRSVLYSYAQDLSNLFFVFYFNLTEASAKGRLKGASV